MSGIQIPTTDDVKADFCRILNVHQLSEALEAEYRQIHATLPSVDWRRYGEIQLAVTPDGRNLIQISFGARIDNHLDSQRVQIQRRLLETQRTLQEALPNRPVTLYLKYDKAEECPGGNSVTLIAWGFTD